MPFITITGPTLYFFYYILEKYRYRFNDFYSIDFLGLHTNQTFHFQLISIKPCKKTKKEKEDWEDLEENLAKEVMWNSKCNLQSSFMRSSRSFPNNWDHDRCTCQIGKLSLNDPMKCKPYLHYIPKEPIKL